MRLLLDENLSYRLVRQLQAAGIEAHHVSSLGLKGQADELLWRAAREQNWMLVSKDNDFRQLAFLRGAPPKVVWLNCHNAPTEVICSVLIDARERLQAFHSDPTTVLMILSV